MNKKTLIKITAVALVAAVIILIILSSFQEPVLVLEDNETGKIYMKIPVSDGEEFSVTFVHSVNKSPCSDIYQIRDGDIYLTKTTLYGFGAGVPTELYGDQVMTRGEDGEMIISNMDTLMTNIVYLAGTVNDHNLSVNGGDDICLQEVCGYNKHVKIYCKGF